MSTLATARALLSGRRVPLPAAAQRDLINGPTWLGSLAVTDAGLTLSDAEASWSSSAVAYRCVMTIAQNLAAVPMVIVQGDEALDDDPIAILWNDGLPGNTLSARTIREVLFARAELKGQAFAFLDRGPTGEGDVLGVHPIYDTVKVVIAKDPTGRTIGSVEGFLVRRNGRDVPLLPSEVLWLRYPHPTRPWEPLAPWQAALYPLESDAYARLWQRSEFKNNARPSGVIGLGNVTPEVYEQALAAIRGRLDGPENASKTLVVNGSTNPEYARISLSPEEMSYLETRVANADEAMLAFGLSADLFRPGATFENRRQAKTALWSDLLVPKLDVLGSEVDRQLVPEPARRAAWDLSEVEALRESQDAIVKRASDATYPDIMTIDESRATLGLEPLPNGMGAYTLTPYRERARLNAQVEILAAAGGALDGVRMIRLAGATRPMRRRRAVAPAPAPVVTHRARSPHKAILAAYARHERIGIRAVKALAARQEKAVLRALRQGERAGTLGPLLARRPAELVRCTSMLDTPAARELGLTRVPAVAELGQRVSADELFDPVFWRGETMRALESFLEGAWSEGGQRTADMLGVSWDNLDPLVLAKMTDRLAVLAAQVTDTTRAALEAQILQAGVEEGESIPKLAERLRTVFDDMAGWRGEMIARTETVGGFNAASHETAAQSGLVVSRRWLATADDRTRPSHREALSDPAGWTIEGTEGTYPNGLRYPGDPAGSPAETIACRCVELFSTDGTF